jgi:hypothetical protein
MAFAIFCFAILFFQTTLPDTFVVPGDYPAQNALTSKRESSYPYISGDSFRAIANFVIDEKKLPFDPNLVKDGDIIFLNGDYLDFFFNTIHPRINAHYILLTHNSDYPIPGPFPHMLNEKKLIAWFGQNTDRQHPKLFALPIGLANKHWPWGTTHALDVIKSNISMYEKKHLSYMNFSTYTNVHRPELNTFFEHCSFCYHAPRKPYLNYLEDMAESKFIVSPPGTGIDCHRHWEALLVGAIPIIQHSSIDPLFDELPVILINDWNEITENFLNNKYTELSSKKFNYDRLYAQYWIDKIKKVQEPYFSMP